MRESHPRDALPRAGRFELSQVQISQPVRAFSRYGTLNPLPSTDPIGGSGLSRDVLRRFVNDLPLGATTAGLARPGGAVSGTSRVRIKSDVDESAGGLMLFNYRGAVRPYEPSH